MRILIAIAMYLLTVPPLAAQPVEDCGPPAPPPAHLVAELTRWIGAHTDYDIAHTLHTPPAVNFCKTGEVITYEGQDLLVDPQLRAAYELSSRKIFLVLPWSADNPRHVSALLHELIHDVQMLNREWPCIGAPEWEAYKLQEKWLLARGIDPEFDWMAVYMWSRCPRDVHPD